MVLNGNNMNYQNLETVLMELVPEHTAAQWHGLLCGLICAGGPVDTGVWFDCAMTFSGHSAVMPEQTGVALRAVFEHTRGQLQLNDNNMEFDLFLPDEETALGLRADALKSWCEGFLYGLSAGGLAQDLRLSTDATEFIEDLAEFCKIGHDESESGESDEFYLLELIEYVRAGVLLLHDELNGNMSPSQTLH
jgi:uncharacterized protein YgfB (UPF0149 family)